MKTLKVIDNITITDIQNLKNGEVDLLPYHLKNELQKLLYKQDITIQVAYPSYKNNEPVIVIYQKT